MKGCSEWHKSNWRKTGPALVWVGVGLDTSCRDLPAVRCVVTPIMVRRLAKEARATALRTIVTIDAVDRMDTASEASVYAAMGRCRLSFWNRRYGVRCATFLETLKVWSGRLRRTARLLLRYKTRRLSKPGVSNNNTRWSVSLTVSPRA